MSLNREQSQYPQSNSLSRSSSGSLEAKVSSQSLPTYYHSNKFLFPWLCRNLESFTPGQGSAPTSSSTNEQEAQQLPFTSFWSRGQNSKDLRSFSFFSTFLMDKIQFTLNNQIQFSYHKLRFLAK
jgi:hypothetical protein